MSNNSSSYSFYKSEDGQDSHSISNRSNNSNGSRNSRNNGNNDRVELPPLSDFVGELYQPGEMDDYERRIFYGIQQQDYSQRSQSGEPSNNSINSISSFRNSQQTHESVIDVDNNSSVETPGNHSNSIFSQNSSDRDYNNAITFSPVDLDVILQGIPTYSETQWNRYDFLAYTHNSVNANDLIGVPAESILKPFRDTPKFIMFIRNTILFERLLIAYNVATRDKIATTLFATVNSLRESLLEPGNALVKSFNRALTKILPISRLDGNAKTFIFDNFNNYILPIFEAIGEINLLCPNENGLSITEGIYKAIVMMAVICNIFHEKRIGNTNDIKIVAFFISTLLIAYYVLVVERNTTLVHYYTVNLTSRSTLKNTIKKGNLYAYGKDGRYVYDEQNCKYGPVKLFQNENEVPFHVADEKFKQNIGYNNPSSCQKQQSQQEIRPPQQQQSLFQPDQMQSGNQPVFNNNTNQFNGQFNGQFNNSMQYGNPRFNNDDNLFQFTLYNNSGHPPSNQNGFGNNTFANNGGFGNNGGNMNGFGNNGGFNNGDNTNVFGNMNGFGNNGGFNNGNMNGFGNNNGGFNNGGFNNGGFNNGGFGNNNGGFNNGGFNNNGFGNMNGNNFNNGFNGGNFNGGNNQFNGRNIQFDGRTMNNEFNNDDTSSVHYLGQDGYYGK